MKIPLLTGLLISFVLVSCSKDDSISKITKPVVINEETLELLAEPAPAPVIAESVVKLEPRPTPEPVKELPKPLMEQVLEGETVILLNGEITSKPIEKKVKYYVVYITAEWSAKCKEHINELKEIYNSVIQPHPDVELLMVSVDSDSSWVKQWAVKESFQWPILMNEQRAEVAPIAKIGDRYARLFTILNDEGERQDVYTLSECLKFIEKL